jgi:hypothetical protein
MIRPVLLMALLAGGLGLSTQAAAQPAGPALIPVVHLAPQASKPPARALAHRLLPDPVDVVDGNAAPLWIRAGQAARDVRHKWTEKQWQWTHTTGMPLNKLPRQEVAAVLAKHSTALQLADLAALRKRCDWGHLPLTVQNLPLFALGEVQSMREVANLINLRCRLALAEGKFDEARRSLVTGLTLARHVGQGETVIGDLVGIALAAIMLGRVEEWLQMPGSPNLYWPLTELPRPLIDARRSMRRELGTLYRSFPQVRRFKEKKLAADEAKVLVEEIFTVLCGFGEDAQVPGWTKKLRPTALALTYYAPARKALIAAGRPAKEVDAMPSLQVVVLAMIEETDRITDEVVKWLAVPTWQGFEPLLKVEKEYSKKAKKDSNPLIALLLPSLIKVLHAQLRLERQVAGLRGAEALRQYAASHAGKAPAKWADLTALPGPIDPFTGSWRDAEEAAMIRSAVLLALLLPSPSVSAAGVRGGSSTLPRFLDDRTVAVLAFEPGKLDVEGMTAGLERQLGAAQLARLRKQVSAWLTDLSKAGAREVYVVASLADLGVPFVVVPLDRDSDVKKLTAALKVLERLELAFGFEKIGAALVAGSADTRERLREMKPAQRPDVVKALAGRPSARLVVVPTTDTARVLEETLPNLPEDLGGGSIRPLARGLRWLSLDLVSPKKLTVKLTIQASDADAAADLDRLVGRALKAVADSKKPAKRLAELWKPRRDEARLVLQLDEKTTAALVGRYLSAALEADSRSRGSANMEKVLAAMLAYEEKNRHFPPFASHDGKGRPLLSWRVHLLPHLGETELYRQFRLDERWDSPHNRKLLAKMPAVYRPANDRLAAAGRTTLLVPLGQGTMFPGPKGVRVAEVTDGTANTILVVDAADEQAVEWTRPGDWSFVAKTPRKGLATRYGGEILVGMVDGTVRFLPATMDDATLKALFTRNGGEDVKLP